MLEISKFRAGFQTIVFHQIKLRNMHPQCAALAFLCVPQGSPDAFLHSYGCDGLHLLTDK